MLIQHYPSQLLVRELSMVFALACLIFCLAVDAGEVSVTNYSFEEPSRADGGFLDNNVTGWVGSGSTVGVFNPTSIHYPNTSGANAPLPAPAESLQLAYINNDGTLTTRDPIIIVTNSMTYSLTVAVGSRLDAYPDGSIYKISLLIDDVEEASTSFPVNETVLPHGIFVDISTSFTTTAEDSRSGGALKIRLHYDEDNTTFGQGNFDHIRLSADSTLVLPPPEISALTVEGSYCSLVVTNLDLRGEYTLLQTASIPSQNWSTAGTFRATSTATNISLTCTNLTTFFRIQGQPY